MKKDKLDADFQEWINFKTEIASKVADLKDDPNSDPNNPNLFGQFQKYHKEEKYKAAFALYLEFIDILKEVRKIKDDPKCVDPDNPVKDAEWLKDKLTDVLKEWIEAAYEHFYWSKTFAEKEPLVQTAQDEYTEFKENYRAELVREAQDVEPEPMKKSAVFTDEP